LNSARLAKFDVFSTVLINEKSNLCELVDEFVNSYILLSRTKNFSYRILIPRKKDGSNFQAKKLGLTIQAEILLAMKRGNLKLSIKEIRYLHDDDHYGWLFLSPELIERVSEE
jgi:uncharacterized protein YpmS